MLHCSYAVVHVELKNQGDDAFKPEVYGDVIIIERKISGTSNATVLKDQQGLHFLLVLCLFLLLYNFGTLTAPLKC